MFGLTLWSAGILVVFAAGLEAYDSRLAMMFVIVTLFALFIRHADEIVKILHSVTPTAFTRSP